MKNQPLVSVTIKCLNGEKYLHKAVQSVLNQNYKSWEIVFFDNHSEDESLSILKRFKDKRIKYFITLKFPNDIPIQISFDNFTRSIT